MSCEKYFAAFPFPDSFIVGAICFVAGYLAAALVHKVKENRMTRDHEPSRVSATYAKIAPALLLFCAFSVIFANVGVFWLNAKRGEDQTAAIETNQANAVTNCQNANESRQASLALWNFIFDSTANAKSSPQQKADVVAIRGWIRKLYMDRDCKHLEKKYVIPPPPVIGKN